MNYIAATDKTFTRHGNTWVGKCLICRGPLRFDAATGEGANIEHIFPRSLGGTSDPSNLGITHHRCNSEKGRNWDSGRLRRNDPTRYDMLIQRLRSEREQRWREPTDTRAAAL
jgi:5-methylcytosine-specific restriction endonuclease McrA